MTFEFYISKIQYSVIINMLIEIYYINVYVFYEFFRDSGNTFCFTHEMFNALYYNMSGQWG